MTVPYAPIFLIPMIEGGKGERKERKLSMSIARLWNGASFTSHPANSTVKQLGVEKETPPHAGRLQPLGPPPRHPSQRPRDLGPDPDLDSPDRGSPRRGGRARNIPRAPLGLLQPPGREQHQPFATLWRVVARLRRPHLRAHPLECLPDLDAWFRDHLLAVCPTVVHRNHFFDIQPRPAARRQECGLCGRQKTLLRRWGVTGRLYHGCAGKRCDGQNDEGGARRSEERCRQMLAH